MNIIQQSDNLKGLSDQQLLQASHDPAGTPPYLIMAEMERRKQMRMDFQAQQARQQGGQPTVAAQLQQTLAQPMQQPGQGQQGQPGQMTPPAPGASPGGLAGLPPPPKLMKRGGRFFAGGPNEDDTPESMYDGPGASDAEGGISGLASAPAGDGGAAVPIAFPQYGIAGAAESKGKSKRLSEILRDGIDEKPEFEKYIKTLEQAMGGHGDYTEHQRLLARQLAHVTQQNPRLGDYLIRAGLGMAASKSPFLSVAAGEGGLAALDYADKQREKKFSDTNSILQQQMALSRLQQGDRAKLGMEALGMMRTDTSERNAQLRGANTQAWRETTEDFREKKLAQEAAIAAAKDAAKRSQLTPEMIDTTVDELIPKKNPFYTEQNAATKALIKNVRLNGGDEKDITKIMESSVNRIASMNSTVEGAKQRSANVTVHVPPVKGVNMVVPDGNGGFVMKTINAGDSVDPGALTSAGFSSGNTQTSATRTMIESAPGVKKLAEDVRKLVDVNENKLGPAKGRWNEFVIGKVGMDDPDFTRLRVDTNLLITKLMRMHVGARGGSEMLKHFQDLLDQGKMSPNNMRAALDQIQSYADDVTKEKPIPRTSGGTGPPQTPAASAHKVGDLVNYKGTPHKIQSITPEGKLVLEP